MTRLSIRPYRRDDLDALYEICLRTADNGADARDLYDDPALPGHVFAAPYALLEPDLCFVLVAGDDVPCGYVVGTCDSARFEARCEAEWFPALRRRYRLPAADDPSRDARMVRLIHSGHRSDPDLAEFPAHLHIDLLPAAQGRGQGARLLEAFVQRLRELRVPALHALTGPGNPRAMRFYERSGFAPIKTTGRTIAYGRRLTRLG